MGTDIMERTGRKDRRTSSASRYSTEFITERTALPLPPSRGEDSRLEMEIYARFMRHLRDVPNGRVEIKILSSIQFTADMMDVGDALVAKTLVDLGLRAPRRAFPVSFLDFADRAAMRAAWDTIGGAPPESIVALRAHWDSIGEDRFIGATRDRYAVHGEGFVTA